MTTPRRYCRVLVHSPFGWSQYFDLEGSASIGDLKTCIGQAWDILPRRQRLTFLGTVLDDLARLVEIDIKSGDIIFLDLIPVRRIRGKQTLAP